MGKDFEIFSYDEDFLLVYFDNEETTELKILLDTGAPDYVLKYFIDLYGEQLDEKYNCCIMFYDMKYDGLYREINNENYGKFVFLDSMYSNKFDML